MAEWFTKSSEDAAKHPTVVALRSRAAWHRKTSEDFLNNSTSSMRQHEVEAESLEATATKVEMELIVKEGVRAGEYRAFAVGFNHEIGNYISVETDQGWNPDPFWCQSPRCEDLQA